MKWQISKLLKNSTKTLEIDEMVDFSDAVKKNPDIRSMSLVHVTGVGKIEPLTRQITFHLTITGEMTLGCALTLDDVSYPFSTTIDPVFTWNVETYDEDSEDYLVKGDQVELASAVWQEIFIQIPLRVVKDNAYEEIKKKGIEILTPEELEQEAKTKVDPRFSILESLTFKE